MPTFYAGQQDYIVQLNNLWDRGTASLYGTSTTSNSISLGSKTFITQANLQLSVGSQVIITNTLDLSKYMSGQVTSYDNITGSLTGDITAVNGSGTFSTWSISVSGVAGVADNLSIGTVVSGSPAAASITGTSPNKLLNLTLEKGDRGLNAKGVWSGATPYVVDDWVTYIGSSYYRKIDGTTPTDPSTDTTNWGILAQKGSSDAVNIGITDDTTAATPVYPTWVGTTTGNLPAKVSSTKLSFIPSTGVLSASQFNGSGAGLTSIPNAALTNSSITLGTTPIQLGTTANNLSGLSSVDITTNSTTPALKVTQTGTGYAFKVEDSTSPDNTPFVIDQNGSVGVGVVTNAFGGVLNLAGGADTIAVNSYNNNDSAGFNLRFYKNRNSNVYANTIVQNNDRLGTLSFYGNDGALYKQAATIAADVDSVGIISGTSMAGRLVFSTTPAGSTTPVERMWINSNGNVGIGGGAVSASDSVRVIKNITGSVSSRGVVIDATIQSDVTFQVDVFQSIPSTQSAAFTLPTLIHFSAIQGTFGAGSTVTSQYGFYVGGNLTGATYNVGFFGSVPAGVGRWNTYMLGTALNYMAGGLLIGSTTDTGEKLQITGNAKIAGTITATNIVTNGYAVGYLETPQNSQSVNYTLVLGDSGKHIYHPSADTTARTFTIPANASVAFPIGTTITFVNDNAAGVLSIAITTDTMRLAGAGTTGTRTLAANGVATAIKLTATSWIISGTGLT